MKFWWIFFLCSTSIAAKKESYSAIDPTIPVSVDDYSQRPKPKYEIVPSQQTDSILKRLQITEELVREYGRAYDYRVHTTAELEDILKQLKASKDSSAPKNHPADESPSGFTAPAGDV